MGKLPHRKVSISISAVLMIFIALVSLATNESNYVRMRLSYRQKTSAATADERVAICVAGSSRSFHYEAVHTALRRNLVDAVRKVYPRTDVFFLMRIEDAVSVNRKPKADPARNATLHAMRLFDPVNITLITESLEVPKHRTIRYGGYRTDDYLPPTHCTGKIVPGATVRVADSLFRSRQCLQLIEAHERSQDFSYDWVYRVRPDVLVFDPVVLPSTLRRDTLYTNQGKPDVTSEIGLWWRKTHWSLTAGDGPIADQMAFSSREVAAIALNAFNVTEDCELYTMPRRIGPEKQLRFWLMKRRQRYRNLPFDWAIVRDHVGPECERLYWQRGHGTNWMRSMKRCVRWGLLHASLFPNSDFQQQLADLNGRTRSPSNLTSW